MLYPLKFEPILKEMIWGGLRIPETYNIKLDKGIKIGESFLVSGLPDDNSVLGNGVLKGTNLKELINQYKADLLGQKVYDQFKDQFPLLIKIIDASDDLSIQVHPDDIIAKKLHDSSGKTEMWYVIDQKEDASLISGFTRKINYQEFQHNFDIGNLMELMNTVKTNKGDIYFIPAGKVHSIGKGNLIAEIQQNSDITYRIFDFNRLDKFGNSRELHHDYAIRSMNYEDDSSGKIEYIENDESKTEIVSCQYFNTNIINTSSTLDLDYSNLDSFVVLICTDGDCEIQSGESKIGLSQLESILIPASLKDIKIIAKEKTKLLEVYIA
ncbi:MAG: class I mannose-6-phosphate isomerase [Bacteroidales bacterium]|nr:class I mannose-6-phosphate isomerase [Bacteroidales bacterium]